MHYQVGGSLTTDAPSYVERQADAEFVEALQRGEFCYVLNSRQMGKSSLMVRSHRKLRQTGYRCAVLDMTNIGSENITPLQWYKGIVKDLWRSFKLTRQADFTFKSWWQDEEDISLLQRLSQFIKDVLLAQFPGDELVIFIDEIDSILSLPFPIDDFFALVRFCYNQRAIDPEYKRIHFSIFGVATPADLIRDRTRTPFNIGMPIYLSGFTQGEAQPLARGLKVQEGDAQAVLKAILSWTNGQPFLTQKLCQLAINSSQGAASLPLTIPPGNEGYWVDSLVQSSIVDRWESQDEPEHLRTIRNRILSNPESAGRLLSIYQRVLEGEVDADDSREQIELVLSGLVDKKEGRLCVKNRIYATIFDLAWVKHQLSQLRPYAQQFDAWTASQKTDESRLLRGRSLKDAQLWSQGKQLSDLDYQYLAASVESDRKAVRQAMKAERQAAENERVQLQLAKEREASKLQRRFLGAVSVAFLAAVGFGGVTFWQYRQSQIGEIKAIATAAEGRFESHHQLEAFEQIITASTKLQNLIRPPAALLQRVQTVLQRTTDGANAINQLNFETEVSSLEVHPDGKLLAVVTAVGDLSFWHPSGESAEVTIAQALKAENNTGQISKVLFSPDGQLMAIALRNNSIQIWSLDGTLVKTLDLEIRADIKALSADNQTLLVRGQDALKLLNIESGQLTSLPAEHRIGQSAMSTDGGIIAGAYRLPPPGTTGAGQLGRNVGLMPTRRQPPRGPRSPGGPRPPGKEPGRPGNGSFREMLPIIGIWNAAGKVVAEFAPTGGPVGAITISPNNDLLATAHVDGEVYLSRPDGELVQVLHGLQSKVRELAFSPNGQLLAAGDIDGNIELWTVGGSRVKLLLGHKGSIAGLAFSPDGTWLASTSQDSTVRLWNTSHPMQTVLAGHTDAVVSLFYSPDGEELRSRSVDQSMSVWQRDSEGAFEIVPAEKRAANTAPYSFSISADRLLIGQIGPGNKLEIVDTNQEKALKQFDDIADQISTVSIAPSGEQIAIASPSGQIKVWRKTTAGVFPTQPQQTWSGANGAIASLAWSPAGQMLVSGTKGGGVAFWDIGRDAGGETGKAIASAEDAHITDVSAVAISPDGRWIASASQDKTVKVWRADGALAQTLVGHEAGVRAIAFSPDSTKLASVSVDGSLKLWAVGDLPPNQKPLLRSMVGHVGRVNYVAFSPDGREIATAGSDRKVIVWKIDEILQLDELDYACQQVGDYLRHSPVVDESARSLCN